MNPTIVAHLGDAYWALGRRAEARMQWRRALSFDPAPSLADRLRERLDAGLRLSDTSTGKTGVQLAHGDRQ